MNKKYDNPLILQILKESKNNISSHLKIDDKQFNYVLQNFVIRAKLSGHNNQIYLIDFLDGKGAFLGDICLKYSSSEKMRYGLVSEAGILNLLYLNKKNCPRVLHSNILEQSDISYIITENVKGVSVNQTDLDIKKAKAILDIIQFHESILRDNMQILNSSSIVQNLHQKIDFRKKILMLLADFVPNFTINVPLSFLNYYLNDERVINKRTIVTDRSSENIFQKQNGDIILIDFSTIRAGSQFDNWIQFIDDPRAHFCCKKEDLAQIFFKSNNLGIKDLKFFYAASVYTNLLQGIFTYGKNPELGTGYFKNANSSFMKLKNKKSALIDISHQHALR